MLLSFSSRYGISKASLFSVLLIIVLSVGLMGCGASEKTNNTASDTNQEVENLKSTDFKVTLLGTGSPILSMERFGNATLVEAGDEKLLFDAGRGAALRLSQMDIMPGEINKLFMTHLHSDHTIGIPDILLTGTLSVAGSRDTEFEVWGPTGTQKMMYTLKEAYEADIDNRIEGNYITPKGSESIAYDIEPGVVYEKNGVQVIAFLVEHDIAPAFGYRINYKGHSVVISGDTTYSENLVENSENVDLLIHEVAAAEPTILEKNKELQNVLSKHTTPEQAGKIFSKAQPKLAVYSHVVLLGGLTEEEANLIERTKENYAGEVVLGEDLMSFEIGEEILVKK